MNDTAVTGDTSKLVVGAMSEETFGALAPIVHANGYRPLPIQPREKKPIPDGWQHFEYTAAHAGKWPQAGLGILTGEVRAIDTDVRQPELAHAIEELAGEILRIRGRAPRRIGAAPKSLLLVRATAPGPKMQTPGYRLKGEDQEAKPHRVEVLGIGQQFVAFGIHPDTGEPYQWNAVGSPATVPVGLLPEVSDQDLRTFLEAAEQLLATHGTRCGRLGRDETGTIHTANEGLEGDRDTVAEALTHIPNIDLEYDDWVVMGLALKGALGAQGADLWEAWSAQSRKNDAAQTLKAWRSFKPTRIGAGTIFHQARQNGWKRPPAVRARVGKDIALLASDDRLIEVNQDNVATVFEERFADRLRFSHDRSRWYLWDGTRWSEEVTQLALDYTRHLTRKLNTQGKREFAKATFCEGVEKFARASRVFAMQGKEWDADPHLLNTPNGTVDLRSGELRPAQQSDLITKCTSVGPQNGAPSMWLEFLKQATEGDAELIEFLRRVCGYCLSGLTYEECLFFVYGTGGNGKGTFTGALFNIAGDYAANASMDTFMASRFERHSTDMRCCWGRAWSPRQRQRKAEPGTSSASRR